MTIEQTAALMKKLQHEIASTIQPIEEHKRVLAKAVAEQGVLREQLLDLAKKAESLSDEDKTNILYALGASRWTVQGGKEQ